MRGKLFNLPAIGRALGFALIAIAIVAAALHFRESPRVSLDHADSPANSDPLAEELKRCQIIANEAKDDAACEAAWAENRRRFFSYAPARASAPQPKTSGR